METCVVAAVRCCETPEHDPLALAAAVRYLRPALFDRLLERGSTCPPAPAVWGVLCLLRIDVWCIDSTFHRFNEEERSVQRVMWSKLCALLPTDAGGNPFGLMDMVLLIRVQPRCCTACDGWA